MHEDAGTPLSPAVEEKPHFPVGRQILEHLP